MDNMKLSRFYFVLLASQGKLVHNTFSVLAQLGINKLKHLYIYIYIYIYMRLSCFYFVLFASYI